MKNDKKSGIFIQATLRSMEKSKESKTLIDGAVCGDKIICNVDVICEKLSFMKKEPLKNNTQLY